MPDVVYKRGAKTDRAIDAAEQLSFKSIEQRSVFSAGEKQKRFMFTLWQDL